MREFLIRRLRWVPIIKDFWDRYERMQAALDQALAERDAAFADRAIASAARDAAFVESDKQLVGQYAPLEPGETPRDAYPTRLYITWAYRLLLGREPEDLQAVALASETSRSDVVKRFINSPEFFIGHVIDNIRPPQRSYMVELDNGFRFWLIYHDEFISPAIAAGLYEPFETEFIKQYVKPGMAVLDIGANLGWFTVNLAEIVGPQGRVDAFEPRSDLFLLLCKTIDENRLCNVTLHNYALGVQNSEGQMIWSHHDVNPGGTNLVSSDFQSSKTRAQRVLVKTLDSCVSHRIDFIKIDVEGSEPLVLRGAERIISEDRPIILLEINPINLLRTAGVSTVEFGEMLQNLGYQLYEILEDGSCGKHMGVLSEVSEMQTIVNVAALPKTIDRPTEALPG
jgi:FkbM family methyltransferase